MVCVFEGSIPVALRRMYLERGAWATGAGIWMGMSLFASLLVIVITMVLEVPLNNKFARWEPEKIPDDWQLMRDAWLRNHWLRTYFGIAAFLFSLVACLIHKA
jgi:hypothetical protein